MVEAKKNKEEKENDKIKLKSLLSHAISGIGILFVSKAEFCTEESENFKILSIVWVN